MVERIGDTLEFTPEEQNEFGLPPQTTAQDAVEIAISYREAGLGLIEQNVGVDTTLRSEALAKHKRAVRASRLASITSSILDECRDEHLEFILKQADAAKQ